MKSISFLLLTIGIVLITVGYMNKINQKKELLENRVEYRFIPQSIYEEQLQNKDLITLNSNMFMNNIQIDEYKIY